MNVFTKIAVFEVNFSHRMKIAILGAIQIAHIFVKLYRYSLPGVNLVLYDH